MKNKTLAFLAGAGLLAGWTILGCGVSEEARQIKIYQDQLGTMSGKNVQDVSALIEKSWDFKLLHNWTKVNPDVETVLKNNPPKHGFSEDEARTIFAEPGDYRVRIYDKVFSQENPSVLRQERPLVGDPGQMGGTVPERPRILDEKAFGFIRVVFRNDKLIHFDAWN